MNITTPEFKKNAKLCECELKRVNENKAKTNVNVTKKSPFNQLLYYLPVLI